MVGRALLVARPPLLPGMEGAAAGHPPWEVGTVPCRRAADVMSRWGRARSPLLGGTVVWGWGRVGVKGGSSRDYFSPKTDRKKEKRKRQDKWKRRR